MSESEAPKKMPKGGRKGGTQFPQVGLKEATAYAKKLVSKTHTGPQPATVILPGAFGSSQTAGKVRASALKQYGLLTGEASAYEASRLAKDLDAAPEGDKLPLLREAFLNAKVFKSLYDIFINDTVSPAKVRQQLASLDVHPDNVDKATKLFIDGAVFAGVGHLDGENITVLPNGQIPAVDASAPKPEEVETSNETKSDAGLETDLEPSETPALGAGPKGPVRALTSVTFSVDSSMDTDKLERQLKLLRRFGVI